VVARIEGRLRFQRPCGREQHNDEGDRSPVGEASFVRRITQRVQNRVNISPQLGAVAAL
jgi:hypothetical protein